MVIGEKIKFGSARIFFANSFRVEEIDFHPRENNNFASLGSQQQRR
jgi:hypothetical protein